MHHYANLIEAMNDLRTKGYITDFLHKENCIACDHGRLLSPEEFVIDNAFRFEEDSDPENQSILYAISSIDGKEKGLLVNTFGIYSDALSDAMIEKLKITHH
ncbi:MAG: phosphoribosylpyrophosphate synthetase [Chitinophagales bacterium]